MREAGGAADDQQRAAEAEGLEWVAWEEEKEDREAWEWAQSQLFEPGRAVAGDEEVGEGARHVEGGGHVEEGEEQDGEQAGNEG